MLDGQETGDSAVDFPKDIDTPEILLSGLRSKAKPLFDDGKPLEQPGEETVAKVKLKFKEILQTYPETPDKELVSDLLTQVVSTGCEAFGINPVELIIMPKELDKNDIARAQRKKAAGWDMKQIFIDPEEIMFRVDILSRSDVSTGKNITDMIFVFMHEMAHLGQATLAEDEYRASKQFPYAERPTEIHADEVALLYCKNLLASLEGKGEKTRADDILAHGLPETIKEAETHRRPLI